jgi:diguanylate cyclase (GGDEF)-like protein
VGSRLRIALVSKNHELNTQMELRLQSKGYQVVIFSKISTVLGFIYSDPPDIMIIDLSESDSEIQKFTKEIKKDNYFSVIPVIGVLGEHMDELFDWESYPLDDFISLPIKYTELFSRISISMQRIQRIFDNNPLTKLPGNTSIQQAVEKALGNPMAVCYVDINNFKPYNDTYGFSRGDEVLRMVARILSNAVKDAGGGFIGHIGGDDFVFIVPLDHAEPVCKTVVANFNIIVSDLFGNDENAKGFYVAKDRKGSEQKFPLLGIAIAVVPVNSSKIQHYGKIAEVAAELKKLAKKSHESCYVVDRRRT